MVVSCCVLGCTNRLLKGNGISFHQIPSVKGKSGSQVYENTERRRREWLKAINRKGVSYDTIKPWTRVCSRHFISGQPVDDDQNPDWAPSQNMGYACATTKSSISRYNRIKVRHEMKLTISAVADSIKIYSHHLDETNASISDDKKTPDTSHLIGIGVQTDVTNNDLSEVEEELVSLRRENHDLKYQLTAQSFTEETFRNDDDKVRYYTGLPNFIILTALYNFLSPHISSGPRSMTSKFQEMLIVLFRMRLDLPVQVLSDMFGISVSATSRIFLKVVDIMFIRMSPLVYWPDRDSLRKTMPREFLRCFGNKVTCIIDCFEIFIETPSSLQARAQTFSNYKHHNTIKYLIGIAPQGVVTFISKGWGGRTSDKLLTENSSFLDNLLPGDLVLADRGFDIQESVGLMCAEVKIPAFTKGKKQLSAFDVEATRKIAHVRIHVERVIGILVQKYAILNSTVQIPTLFVADKDSHTTLDKIVTICCALVNMCPSVVPFD